MEDHWKKCLPIKHREHRLGRDEAILEPLWNFWKHFRAVRFSNMLEPNSAISHYFGIILELLELYRAGSRYEPTQGFELTQGFEQTRGVGLNKQKESTICLGGQHLP